MRRAALGRAAAILGAAGALAACQYAPDFVSGETQCSLQTGCPGGFVCTTDGGERGVCVSTTDGGGTGGAGGKGTGGSGTGGKGGATGGAGGSVTGTGGAAGHGGSGGNGGAGAGGSGTGGAGTGGSGTGGAGGSSDAGVCPTVCEANTHRCAGGLLESCALMNGCLAWTAGMSCGGHATCTENGAGTDASCVCAAAPSGCNGQVGSYCSSDGLTLETCLLDSGCLYLESPATTCPSGKPCTTAGGTPSCSCPSPPAACMGVTGPTCSGSAAFVTCSRDSGTQCLVVSTQSTSCEGAQQCSGVGGSATCACPAPPVVCQGFTSGTVCSGNDVYDCTTGTVDGCVSATATAVCDAGKPCGGAAGSAACTCQNPASPGDCTTAQDNGSHCSGTTLIKCTTNSDGCTSESTTACPSTGACVHGYPTAICVSETDYGWPTDTGSGTETNATGFLSGVPVTVSATSTLRRFGVVSHTGGPQIIMALYASDASGNPTTRLASIGTSALAVGANEFTATPAGVTLDANTVYWIMVATSATATIGGGASQSVTLEYSSYTFGNPLPSTWPATFSSSPITPPPDYYIVALPQ